MYDDVEPPSASADVRALLRRYEHLIKYFVIGVTASSIDVLLFMFLYNVVGTSELFAHSISVLAGALFSFGVNARHNFKATDRVVFRFFCFFAVCSIGYVIGYMVIAATVQAGWGANIGKIVSLPVVFVTQYVLNSRITFHKSP